MTLFAFVGVVVTSASAIIYGSPEWDPVKLASRFDSKLMVTFAMIGIIISTLATNIAANIVSPANDFSNLSPKKINFKLGGYITGVIGVLIFPWKLMADPNGYIFTWLIAYSSLLGPIGGIMIVDYYFIRNKELAVDELYSHKGRYRFTSGFNIIALIALVAGILPNVPGFLTTAELSTVSQLPHWIPDWLYGMYHYAWFVGFFVSGFVYWIFTKNNNR
jgi:nucleobase:cation symporter-1, NCS1 family